MSNFRSADVGRTVLLISLPVMATADREVREALERAQADLKSTQRELDREREQVRDLEARTQELAVQSRENDTLRQLAAEHQAQLEQARDQLQAVQAQLKAPTGPVRAPSGNLRALFGDDLPFVIFVTATVGPLGAILLFLAGAAVMDGKVGAGLGAAGVAALLFGCVALAWRLRRPARRPLAVGPARAPGSDADRLPPESLSPEDSQRARQRTGAER